MRIIDLAAKDLLQIMKDRKSAGFLLAMPIMFTLFFGWMFTNAFAGEDPRLPVGVINNDVDNPISISLLNLLEMSEIVRPVVEEEATLSSMRTAVDEEQLAAAIHIPEGYGVALLAGQDLQAELIVKKNSQAGETATKAIQALLVRLYGTTEIGRISAEALAAQGAAADTADQAAFQEEAAVLAGAAWLSPPFDIQIERSGQQTEQESEPISPYGQASPGTLVQFAIFGLVTSAMILVLERKTKTMQRLLTTSISRAEIIAGHVLAMFVIVFLQEMALIALGQLAFGVDYMRQPAAILVVAASLAMWAACLGLFISTVSATEEHVVMWSTIGMMVLGALGGTMFPLDVAGKAFAAVGRVTPTAWAMTGFQNIVSRGLDFNSVLLPAGILAAYAVVFFGLALWRFKFE